MATRIGIIVLVVSALLVGSSALAEDKSSGVKLTHEELKKLFEPSLLIGGNNVRGYAFAEVYVGGGEGIVQYILTDDQGHGWLDTGKGTWRLDGDKVCVTYPQARSITSEQCRYLYRLADGSYESRSTSGDTLWAAFRIVSKK